MILIVGWLAFFLSGTTLISSKQAKLITHDTLFRFGFVSVIGTNCFFFLVVCQCQARLLKLLTFKLFKQWTFMIIDITVNFRPRIDESTRRN